MITTVATSGQVLLPNGGLIALDAPAIYNYAPVGSAEEFTLTGEETAIPVPSGAMFVSIQMPALNATGVKLYGQTGESGIAIHETLGVACLALDPSQSHIYLKAASAMTAPVTVIFG
jgi:hypothetical protein